MKHLTFDESVAARDAWNARCAAAQSTPPAENDEARRVPPAADSGQGVCIPLYSLSYSDIDGHFDVCSGVGAADAVVLLRSLLGRGISAVTVERLP